ncbi:nitrite/sulfite reductase [Temperatibacter marinus]|uniref:Nitrite/sulfite reductase n=1 Tax=Temperatibacter marinus TaxID=1456591 RepID=A0AA52EG95_9PROT|nr:nitrite/sulfite reductase [Temperatibacter marinus]WND01526.1 nitrite/sulfite reductase [Temperatibacter marinus]
MYAYDTYDHALVNARVEEFRDQVNRRLSGELTEEEFRPLRLMNGLYLQLHAYMLRVAIPYGTLNSAQLHTLADIADKYDKGYGHFTTRQNIQYNWPKLVETPDILADLASVEMHAIQTSGNCIRNVTTDHFAGAAKDELFDTRPHGELIRQWSTFHPEFSFLPRKFKIAVAGATVDRAALRWHDIALQAIIKESGERGFEVYVGGGMGRSPFIAKTIRDFIPEDQLIAYLEAMLRVYNQAGRRDNKYKARIKILVHEMGLDAYKDAVEKEYALLDKSNIDAPKAELERLYRYFLPPTLEVLSEDDEEVAALAKANPLFSVWLDRNIDAHKVDGHRIVTISLKPHGGIAGDATSEQMRLVADLSKDYSQNELRVSHEQNLILPHVALRDLPTIFKKLDAAGLSTANAGLMTDMIVCPGLDYCSLANARSIPLSQKIAKRFDDIARLQDIGELKVKISGCINSCGHHHAGHIGILGVDKKGVENYQLLLGGSGGEDASKAKILGRGFDEDGTVDALERVIDVYLRSRNDGERFLDTYRRIGEQPFKEAVYDH